MFYEVFVQNTLFLKYIDENSICLYLPNLFRFKVLLTIPFIRLNNNNYYYDKSNNRN